MIAKVENPTFKESLIVGEKRQPMSNHAAVVEAVLAELAPDWPRDRSLFDPVKCTKPKGVKVRAGKGLYIVTVPLDASPMPIGVAIVEALNLDCNLRRWMPSDREIRAIVLWEHDGSMSPVRYSRMQSSSHVMSIDTLVFTFQNRSCPKGMSAPSSSWG